GVHAQSVSLLGNRIPSPIVDFELNLGDFAAGCENPRAHLVNDLLNASGFKCAEHLAHECAHALHHLAVCERCIWCYVAPFQIEPHVQRPVLEIRKGGVFIANEALERASTQTKESESTNGGTHRDDSGSADLDLRS